MKKIISALLLFLFIFNIFNILNVNAVNTDSKAENWTKEKASHLAKKVLFTSSKEKIEELYQAGSAKNAVDIIFPSLEGPNKDDFNNILNNLLTNPNFDTSKGNDMAKYYFLKKYLDPYEAKAKLFLIFEDIFSVDVDSNRKITYTDIENTHNLLYSHSLGNYKEMIKRNLNNNGQAGNYSLGAYLDLFNQTKPTSPNENYAREILQLFLMYEYKPYENAQNQDERNYTETDLNRLARILVGMQAEENTKKVSYNNDINNIVDPIYFLSGALKDGDSFPFYNSVSGSIDIQILKNPINGNNGLTDNIIDYIFSKRADSIGLFLADKLYRFYIAENPSKEDLELIKNDIIKNNFELYPSVKWLLSSDMMYSDKSMNSIIYKNPIELSINTFKLLGLNTNDIINNYSLYNLNSYLGWSPYYPGSIFGRDGFDENKVFFTEYTQNQWITRSSLIANYVDITQFVDLSKITSPLDLINTVSEKLIYLRNIDEQTKEKLIKYLTTDDKGNAITFNINDINYQKSKVKGLIHMMIILPEYIMQSGVDLPEILEDNKNDFYQNDNSKLILIELPGGYDWLNGIVSKKEYETYLERRGVIAKKKTDLLDLNDDFYISKYLQSYKDLFDAGDLKVFNRNGTIYHSRGHDSAMRKSTSQESIEDPYDEGIIGNILMYSDPTNTIVLGNSKPNILRKGKYLNIGSSGADFENYSQATSQEKLYQLDTIKNILNAKIYPKDSKAKFVNAIKINDVAVNSKTNGGRDGAGYNLVENLSFVESLINNNVGKLYHLATGGYDTHKDQNPGLDDRTKYVADTIKDFYEKNKNNKDITILLYSEFGRTTRVNSTSGTDHGMGGGKFMISNNPDIKRDFIKNVYGTISIEKDHSDYLGVGIDYRAIYSKILKSLYYKDISNTIFGEYSLEEYCDDDKPKIELFRKEFSENTNGKTSVNLVFEINDGNFIPSQASYIRFFHGADKNNFYEESRYNIEKYMYRNSNNLSLYIKNLPEKTLYNYKVIIYDNQYNETLIEGSFVTPEIKNNDTTLLSKDTITRLKKFNKTSLTGSLLLDNNSKIILSDTKNDTYIGENDIKMLSYSGTYVQELKSTSTGEIVWNGGFILPHFINKDFFLKDNSNYAGKKLSNFNIENIVKLGADILNLEMILNKEVDIELAITDASKYYTVIYSENGIDWYKNMGEIKKQENKLTFKTNHFSYFAILETDSNGNIIDNSIVKEEENDDDNGGNEVETTTKKRYSAGASKTIIRDYCPLGDFTESYYDKQCGSDPKLKEAIGYIEKSQIYNTDKTLEKINNFDENIKLDSKQLTIDLENKIIEELKDALYTIDINGYKIYQLENSKYNMVFEKIAKYLLQKQYKNTLAKEKLINKLNEIALFYFKPSKENKKKARECLKELINIYNSEKINKKIYKKRVINKQEQVENNNAGNTQNTQINNNLEENPYIYKIGVDSIQLKADPYWKSTNAILYKGDIVEQITAIHELGFFKVKVISSKDGYNNIEGYIFKKHLTK